jgi:hypothetical protein
MEGTNCAESVNLVGHKMATRLLSIFHTVELHRLTITVFQVRTEPAAEDYEPKLLSFGLAPRDTTTMAARSSVVGYIPHLADFVSSALGNEKTVTWGDGGLPFPPSLQLDLSAAEVKSKYPEVIAGWHEQPAEGTKSLVALRVSFVLRCTGTGFGTVY